MRPNTVDTRMHGAELVSKFSPMWYSSKQSPTTRTETFAGEQPEDPTPRGVATLQWAVMHAQQILDGKLNDISNMSRMDLKNVASRQPRRDEDDDASIEQEINDLSIFQDRLQNELHQLELYWENTPECEAPEEETPWKLCLSNGDRQRQELHQLIRLLAFQSHVTR